MVNAMQYHTIQYDTVGLHVQDSGSLEKSIGVVGRGYWDEAVHADTLWALP